MSVSRAAYWIATAMAAPLLRPWLRLRVARGKEDPARLPERWGRDRTPRPDGKLIWLHAASVGETASLLPVIAGLDLDVHVLFTTGTRTAADLLAERLPQLGVQGRVMHRFVPLDVPWWAARFVRHWRPDAAAFVESELWPNLLAACRRRRVKLALLNGRMSARSAARWARLPGLIGPMLRGFDWVQARSDADAARLGALGAANVIAPGDLKFAAPPLPGNTSELARLQVGLGRRPVWLAASTHEGEEDLIADLHTRLAQRHLDLLTIIVPRHPERGAALAEKLHAPRRSLHQPPDRGIWIADTLGELGLFYRLCRIVFVGKSLVSPGGGQNPLEPARLGCAVAVGPHTGNFTDALALLDEAGALSRVADAAALERWVDDMLRRPEERARLGDAGQRAASALLDLPLRIADELQAMVDGTMRSAL